MNLVQKYGGTCLSGVSDIAAIAKHVAKTKGTEDGLVLVLASVSGIAQEILDTAAKVNDDIAQTELDALFAAGEQQTAALMAVALQKEGIDAESVADLKDFSMTELDFGEKKKAINTEAIERILAEKKVAVVAGFQGIGEYDAEDTAGRFGAAATAVAIAAQLGCDCELYGDTNAVYSMDKAVKSDAKPVSEISYEEVMEMILLGESNLESRAIELAKIYDVKVYVGKPMEADKSGGTNIMNQNLIVEEAPVTGVSVADNIVIYTLKGVSNESGAVAQLFELLGELEINIDMISQQSEGEGTCTIAFSCDTDQTVAMDKAVAANSVLKELTVIKQDNLSMVSITGVGMASHSGVASKVFTVLAEQSIKHYQITTSEISISVTVDAADKGAAVVALGEAFNL